MLSASREDTRASSFNTAFPSHRSSCCHQLSSLLYRERAGLTQPRQSTRLHPEGLSTSASFLLLGYIHSGKLSTGAFRLSSLVAIARFTEARPWLWGSRTHYCILPIRSQNGLKRAITIIQFQPRDARLQLEESRTEALVYGEASNDAFTRASVLQRTLCPHELQCTQRPPEHPLLPLFPLLNPLILKTRTRKVTATLKEDEFGVSCGVFFCCSVNKQEPTTASELNIIVTRLEHS